MKKEIFIQLPKLGESIVSAVIVKWLKNEGDEVFLDEPILEVSTDKVNSEIPSPEKGVLKKILVPVDAEVDVGASLAVLEVFSENEKILENEVVKKASISQEIDHFLSPAVLSLMKEANICPSYASKIPKTGMGNRLTKKDLQKFIDSQKREPLYSRGDVSRDEEIIPMSPMRKAIAENMVLSFYQAPHATLATSIDVTKIMRFIESSKEAFFQEHGCKLSITAFVAFAIAKALEKYPVLNSSLQNDTIIVKKTVNLGIAVSVDQAVIVPVITNAEKYSLEEIALQIATFAKKAKQGELKPDDIQGGSITLTNFGISGIEFGIPIIKYPEVAILGLGAVTKKVIVTESDAIAIASVCSMSLTFDHRVLDGLYGCGFLNELKSILEIFSFERIALAKF